MVIKTLVLDKRGVALFALGAFLLASSSCSYDRVLIKGDRLAGPNGKRIKIIGANTKTESLEFLRKRPARVRNNEVVGDAYKRLTISRDDIAIAARTGKTARVVLKDGRRFEVLSSLSTEDSPEDVLECEVLSPVALPLASVVDVWTRRVNGGKTALTVLGAVIIIPLIVLLVFATEDPDPFGLSDGWDSSDSEQKPAKPKKSVASLFARGETPPNADQTEFRTTEWARETGAELQGMSVLRLMNETDVPRNVDAVYLVAIDHPAGVEVAPDPSGTMHTYAAAVAPSRAVDAGGRDIAPLLAAKDGREWRSQDGETPPAPGAPSKDTLIVEFPKPEKAGKVKLVVDATNLAWGPEYEVSMARAAAAAARPPAARAAMSAKGKPAPIPSTIREEDYARLLIWIETPAGWEARQAIFAGGPVPAKDMIYPIDISGTAGPVLRVRLEPPSGYWSIDRLAVDYAPDQPIQVNFVDVAEACDMDGADVRFALVTEDGTVLSLGNRDETARLTFSLPVPVPGLARTLFLKTRSVYEMPRRSGDSSEP